MPTEDQRQRRATILVPRDHPAIPGHFPGNPVVPGVLILHEVILAIGHWLGRDRRVRRLLQARFLAPLRPGEEVLVELAQVGDTVRFSVRRAEVILATGAFGLEPAEAA